jgi:hypothetical protein
MHCGDDCFIILAAHDNMIADAKPTTFHPSWASKLAFRMGSVASVNETATASKARPKRV